MSQNKWIKFREYLDHMILSGVLPNIAKRHYGHTFSQYMMNFARYCSCYVNSVRVNRFDWFD